MKPALATLFLALLIAGCQSPLVTMRRLSYEGRFAVDGNQYAFKSDYNCHYEDVSSFSERGPSWHNRAGSGQVKVIGRLSDGARYQVVPIRPSSGYNETCEDKTEAVATRLFIELADGRVESFDKIGDHSADHKVTLLESRFAFNGSAITSFEPQENWAGTKKAQPQAVTRYYTVWLSEYASDNWEKRPGVREYIKTKKIPWIESGKSFPFNGWSNDDAEFAREHRGALRWKKLQTPLTPSADREEIWRLAAHASTIRWVLESIPADGAERSNRPNLKGLTRWIEYKGSRIEIPIQHYYRLLYDEERDRIIQISVEHVDLW